MVAGAPRTKLPGKEELIELGKDLVEWATDESEQAKKEKRLRYCQWYSLKHGYLHNDWDNMVKKPEFFGYYEKAQTALAQRWLTEMNPSIAHRFIRIYCPEIRKDEDEQKAYEHALGLQNNNLPTQEMKVLISDVKKLNDRSQTQPQADQKY